MISVLSSLVLYCRTELIKDLECQVSYNLFDEATIADWKGRDLRQTNSIPNIDILLLAIRKVSNFFEINIWQHFRRTKGNLCFVTSSKSYKRIKMDFSLYYFHCKYSRITDKNAAKITVLQIASIL